MAHVKVKVSEEEGAKLLKLQKEREQAMKSRPDSEPSSQKVTTYYERPDKESDEPIPKEQLERQELNRKLREMQEKKEDEEKEEEEEEKSFAEKHPVATKIGKRVKDEVNRVADNIKNTSKTSTKEKKKDEEEEDEEDEEMEILSSKKSKKSKKNSKEDEDFLDGESHSEGSKKPFSTDYKEAYSGGMGRGDYQSAYAGKGMGGKYQEAYTGKQLGNVEYQPPHIPKTHPKIMQQSEQQEVVQRPQVVRHMPPQQQIPLPTIGRMGNPALSMGSTLPRGNTFGNMPRIAVPSLNGPKGTRGNIPSINLPTLGKSTLMLGNIPTKTANNKMGNIPRINIPSVGKDLVIGGKGKKPSVGISLGGDIPSFGLPPSAQPIKKKRV